MQPRQRNPSLKTPLDRSSSTSRGKRMPLFCVVLPFFLLGSISLFMVLSVMTLEKPPSQIDTLQNNGVYRVHSSDSTMILSQLRNDFYHRYGGKEAAQAMLDRGIQSFGSSQHTAQRMVRALSQNRPFSIAFAGYSVTVGRGNYFRESFPFVVQDILKEPLKQVLGLDLVVRNAAIGGIPSFPYGWCLDHFMGSAADIISWDYAMNEGMNPNVFESYLRHGMQLPHRPMLIVLANDAKRKELLKKYAQLDIVKDAMSVSRGGVVDQSLLDLPNDQRPGGLQDWDEFGAPNGCPGRSKWHPKKKEHELIGWMIVMHLLEAIEKAHDIISTTSDWKQVYSNDKNEENLVFPPPLHDPPPNDKAVTALLYGHATDETTYAMKDVQCRTSFLPASDTEQVLPSVVVSGISDSSSTDMMQERSDDMYKSGWVLDVSKVERDTKKKVEKCGGLGYIDMKVALYGIPESGTLRLWLPYSGTIPPSPQDDAASHWFNDLIICEANEKRDEKACQLDRDVSYIVGGVQAKSVVGIEGAGVYLKRKTCFNIGIPTDAKVTRLANVKTGNGEDTPPDVAKRLQGNTASQQDVGLLVDIAVPGTDVTRANGACCVSHIIWEQL